MYQFAEKCPQALRAVLCAAFLLPVTASLATAEGQGDVVLTIDGAVSVAGGALDLDMDALQAMPPVSFATATNWTDGVSTFTGVPLRALLDAAGATGTEVQATALNNYSVIIPMDGIDAEYPIVAYSIDGQPFSRRDKGPLWVIYPYDADDAFRNEVIYGRSVWQLRSLSVQ